MSQVDVPIRGKPDLACEICGLVGTNPTSRETVVDGYEKGENTINRAIRYAISLNLMEDVEDGIKATNLGMDLAHTKPDEERRAAGFRRAISQDDEYAKLVDALFQDNTEDQVERRDVEKQLRIGMNLDVSDNSRERAATTFLKTIEAAGIGEYKRGSQNAVSRLEIRDAEKLDDLLSQIRDEDDPSSESEDTQEAPQNSTSPPSPEMSPQPQPNGATPISSESLASMYESTFNIKLELDGTEDPDQIRTLVAAVREGLEPDGGNQPGEARTKEDTENDSTDSPTEDKMNGEEPDEEDTPDSSLGDFS